MFGRVAGSARKAARDAECLADCLGPSGDVATALAGYERQQLDFGQRIVRHSRTLGADRETSRSARDPRRGKKFARQLCVSKEIISHEALTQSAARCNLCASRFKFASQFLFSK
jgi:hypothetical protein